MKIRWQDKTRNVRIQEVEPGRCKPGDFITGPAGILQIVTVQPGCPIWESNNHSFCAILLKTESGQEIPAPRELPAKIQVLRPVR